MSSTTSKTRKSSRTSFGSVRQLPSGRWQARFSDGRDERHTAPFTCPSKRAAEDWLATVRADMVRGAWRSPEMGAITVVDYTANLLAVRVDLAPKTLHLYEELARLWINAPHQLPLRRGGTVRTINLGEVELGDLTVVALIRDWYAAAIRTTEQRAATRATEAQLRQREKVHAARSWALDQGLRVGATGRLPAEILRAWEDAGRPGPDQAPKPAPGRVGRANPPGRARVAQAYRYLKTVLQQAVRDGRIDANPCQISSADLIRTPERVPTTPEQINALAAAMPPRWAAAVQVAAWSSLRAGELFGLARRHVDLQAGTVRVERAVTYLPGEPPFLGQTMTESSRRTVHLPPHVVLILAEHMTRYTGRGADALVFADERGRIAPAKLRQ